MAREIGVLRTLSHDLKIEEDKLQAGEIPGSASLLHVITKRLGRLLDSDQAETLSQAAGLTIPEWRILYILATDGPMSQRDLIRKTKMEQSHASRVTKAITAKGFIHMERDSEDMRRWICRLTDLGMERFNLASPVMSGRKERLDAALSAEERRQFIALSYKIARQAQLDVPTNAQT